ncbi:MAG: SGNH/GDSL hydrolase family protein [Peptococcaceae bacterium]|nr:SGNH/GDSL hydrolase family protein [Peptococcaceae bacterium]
MKWNKNVIKVVCYGLIFCVLFINLQGVFQAKWEEDTCSYERIKQFYNTEPIDVVFIGSSHIHYSVNPLLLYKGQGISSHNFSSAGQDSSIAFLYVKEALKKDPKVIVLDVLGLKFWAISESQHRKGIDPLPISIDKLRQVQYIFSRNEKYQQNVEYGSFVSYIFPFLRYHDRWKELQQEDFDLENNIYVDAYHGYAPHYQTVKADFSEYNKMPNIKPELLNEQKQLYKQIVQICEENNVELLLVKSPSPLWRAEYHQIIMEWAEEFNVPFIDYNNYMEELNIQAGKDFCDETSHLNDIGATKMTIHLGEYLKQKYNLTDHRGEAEYASWDDDWNIYQQDKAAYFLSHENELVAYLEKLKNPNYTVYITAKDSLGGDRYPALIEKLQSFGLAAKLLGKGRICYQAILNDGTVIYEKLSDEALTYQTELNRHKIKLVSKSYNVGNVGSIQIDHEEYFVNKRGLGFVVYDNLLGEVVDSVTFDIYDGGKAYRN